MIFEIAPKKKKKGKNLFIMEKLFQEESKFFNLILESAKK